MKSFVISDFQVGYDPVQTQPSDGSPAPPPLLLTSSSRVLAGSEPIYVALLGRPAGLINWLLAKMGFIRRLEFLMTQRQAIYSLTSVSSFESHVSEIAGLNSVTVSLTRPLRRVLSLLAWAALSVYLSTQVPALAFEIDASGALSGLRFSLIVLGVGLAIYAAYVYFAKRITSISFSEGGATTIAMGFVPSIVEGKAIDATSILKVAKIFHALKN